MQRLVRVLSVASSCTTREWPRCVSLIRFVREQNGILGGLFISRASFQMRASRMPPTGSVARAPSFVCRSQTRASRSGTTCLSSRSVKLFTLPSGFLLRGSLIALISRRCNSMSIWRAVSATAIEPRSDLWTSAAAMTTAPASWKFRVFARRPDEISLSHSNTPSTSGLEHRRFKLFWRPMLPLRRRQGLEVPPLALSYRH